MPSDNSIQNRQPGVSLFLATLHPDAPLGDIEIDRVRLMELWEFGLRYHVAMLLYSWLRRHEGHLTDDAMIFLEGQRPYFLRCAARSMWQGSEEQHIIDLLSAHGIDACIIKGNDIAQRIYGDAMSRSSCDIDILIREQDILEVNGLLCDSGYIRDNEVPLKFWMGRLHHASYSNHTNGHTIEVHWTFGIPSFFTLTSDDIWRGTERIETGRIVLSPEMQMIQMLMHHHMHAFREMRSLVDVLWIFYGYDEVIDWQHLFSRLKHIGLVKTAQITMHQCLTLWGDSCRGMRSFQSLQAACEKGGYAEPDVLCRYFSFSPSGENGSHPFSDKFVMRFALDRNASIWHSFLKSLIPSPETIKTFYSDGRNWTLPMHYLRFLGWRIREWSAN